MLAPPREVKNKRMRQHLSSKNNQIFQITAFLQSHFQYRWELWQSNNRICSTVDVDEVNSPLLLSLLSPSTACLSRL